MIAKSGPLPSCAAGDIAANLFMSAAVVHGAPTTAEVLGLIKKQPWTAGASLEPGQLRTGEQIKGSKSNGPKHHVQPRSVWPGQLIRRIARRQLGMCHGVGDKWPQISPMRRWRRSFEGCCRTAVDHGDFGEDVDQDAAQSVRSSHRNRADERVLASPREQRIRLIRRQNADASRPPDELGVRPGVVVALRPLRIVNRVGEVQREMPAHNGQLPRVLRRVGCCFHQNSLYQLHTSRRPWVCFQHEHFCWKHSGKARTWAIALICVAQFVVVLDATIVTTALPAIRQALGFTDAGLQWVFTAYALVFGGLLIFGGRVADVVGRRRTFLIGLVLFAAASAGCALAWSPAALVAARVLQGAGPLCSRLPRWPCSRR